MEKRYFLSNGNSKWISVGIVPESKLLSTDAQGFYADLFFGGVKMTRPMSAGGINGFLFICRMLRSFDEFKFSFPGTKADYSSIKEEMPFGICQKNFGSTMCYQISNYNTGETVNMAITSVMELLKIEKILLAAVKTMSTMSVDMEKKFNDFVSKSSNDFEETLKDIEKLGDLLAIEFTVNFSELTKMCIEEMVPLNQLQTESKIDNENSRKRRVPRTTSAAAKRASAVGDVLSPEMSPQKSTDATEFIEDDTDKLPYGTALGEDAQKI